MQSHTFKSFYLVTLFFISLNTIQSQVVLVKTVIQKYDKYATSNSLAVSKKSISNKIGTGVIAGIHQTLFWRIGVDMHIGLVGQFGKEYIDTKYLQTPTQNTVVDQWKPNARFIWGFNLYIALGK